MIKMVPHITMAGIAVALVASLATAKADGDKDTLARFQRVLDPMVKAINAGDYSAVRRDFSAEMAQALTPEKTSAFFESLRAQLGLITKTGRGRFTPPNTAVFPAFYDKGAVLNIKIVLDAQGKIAGLLFLPPAADIPVPKENATALRLPLDGRWEVFWGGDAAEQNQHHDVPNQRYAFDFLVTDDKGESHRGEGIKNEDYFAFGQEVLAPANGTVTDVISGVRDNVPGSMNAYSALGNAVFIQHSEHEVSVLAHLKQDSIRVHVGQKVTAGQVIGLCGNSGNSSESHLHYHLQNTPVIQDGTGIKCYFANTLVWKDGKSSSPARYSPVKGEIVSFAAPAIAPTTQP